MVDIKPLKRTAPAPSPDGYPTLQAWLLVATDRRGMPAELAKFCSVERQNVQKWLNGSLPAGPTLRNLIADWAQVPHEAVRNLILRDEAQRDPALKKMPLPVRKKPPAHRAAR